MDRLSIILKETLIFRLVIAIGLIVMSLLPLFSDLPKVIMLSFSVLISGAGEITEMLVSLKSKDFLNYHNFVIYISVVILFIIGFSLEAAIISIIYELFIVAIEKVTDLIRTKSIDMIDKQSLDIRSFIYQIFDNKDADVLLMEGQIKSTVTPVLLLAIIFAILYAVLMPIIKNLTLTAAIHRALSIIIISTPISLVSSYRAVGSTMLCQSASNGVIFNKASALEAVSDCKYALIDDDIIDSSDKSRILYSHSSTIDNSTLLNFIYHVVYMSDQSFAKTIKRNLRIDYQTGIVFDTTDIPGYGIKATINGTMVLFGNKELCNRFGIDVSNEENPNIRGAAYYLCLSDKCVGLIVVSEYNAADLNEISTIFHKYNIIISLFSNINELKVSKKPILSIFYPEKAKYNEKDINLTVSENPGSFDGSILPDYVDNISTIPYISRAVTEKAFNNTAIAYGIKILIIILSITGFCVPWIAITVDFTISILLTGLVQIMPDLHLIEIFNGSGKNRKRK